VFRAGGALHALATTADSDSKRGKVTALAVTELHKTACELASVACSMGGVDRVVWLCIATLYLTCVSIRGRGVVFKHYNRSLGRSARRDIRDASYGAIVPLE
jgi:hypothetical protein